MEVDLITEDLCFKILSRYPRLGSILLYLKDNGCPMCSYKPFSWEEFEFHVHSTHGIPKEILVDWVKDEI